MTQTATAARRLDASVTMCFAASKGQPACIDARGNTQRQQSCRHTSAISNQEAPYTQSTASTETHPKQLLKPQLQRSQKNTQKKRSRTCCTNELLLPAAAALLEKTMFCFFCSTQCQWNLSAVIAMGFAASRGKRACTHARGKARRQQPCGRSNAICNPKKSTRAKYCEHAYTARQKKHRRSRALCTQTTFHGWLQPLDLKTQCFAIPQHKSNANFLQPWQWVLQHQVASPHELLDTRKYSLSCSSFFLNASSMQLSCRHYSGFCSITWQACMYLCT